MDEIHATEKTVDNNRILIIDDDHHVHETYDSILNGNEIDISELQKLAGNGPENAVDTSLRYQLLHAYQGEEGVELVRNSLSANQPIAAAFIDVRMPPGMSGFEAAKEIYKIDSRIHIIILSAYSDHTKSEFRDVIPENLYFLRKPAQQEDIEDIAMNTVAMWNTRHRENEKNRISKGMAYENGAILFGCQTVHLLGNASNGIMRNTYTLKNIASQVSKLSIAIHKSLEMIEQGELEATHKLLQAMDNTISSSIAESIDIELETMTEFTEDINQIIKMMRSTCSEGMNIDTFSLSELISDLELQIEPQLLQRKINYTIDYTRDRDFAFNLPYYPILKTILAITTNAIEAIEEAESENIIGHETGQLNICCTTNSPDWGLIIEITDNGIGMDSTWIEKSFYINTTTKDKNNHNGLSLHNALNLIRHMNGNIKLISKGYGLGLTAVITLPIGMDTTAEHPR